MAVKVKEFSKILKVITTTLKCQPILKHSYQINIENLTKWQFDKMAIWQNGNLKKGKLTKWQYDKMAIWLNGKLTKRQVDKKASWENGNLTKWQVDKKASHQRENSLWLIKNVSKTTKLFFARISAVKKISTSQIFKQSNKKSCTLPP